LPAALPLIRQYLWRLPLSPIYTGLKKAGALPAAAHCISIWYFTIPVTPFINPFMSSYAIGTNVIGLRCGQQYV
jgi:hypothetical protein